MPLNLFARELDEFLRNGWSSHEAAIDKTFDEPGRHSDLPGAPSPDSFRSVLFAMDSSAAATGAAPQSTFAAPSEAGQALQAANRANDLAELRHILGPDSQDVVSSGDPAEDHAARLSFVAKYNEMNRWVAMTDGTEVLYIGADNYPFPIPLAKDSDSRWYFDMAAGKQEMHARHIGRNELLAIDACYALADAEDQYSRNGNEYALRIISSEGKQRWPVLARIGNAVH